MRINIRYKCRNLNCYLNQPVFMKYRNRKENVVTHKKRTSIMFALLLGFIGIHRFNLGHWHIGMLYIVLFIISMSNDLVLPFFDHNPWVTMAACVGYVEAFRFYSMSEEEYAERYLEPAPVIRKGKYLKGKVIESNPHQVKRKLLKTANDLFESFQYQEAAQAYEKVLSKDYNDGRVRVLAARCYSLVEDEVSAYRHLNLAVKLDAPNLNLIHIDEGFAWLRTRDDFELLLSNNFQRKSLNFSTPNVKKTPSFTTTQKKSTILDQLERLGEMKERGLLSVDEFERAKQRLLE